MAPSVAHVHDCPVPPGPAEPGLGRRAFRVVLPDGRAYWTVADDGYATDAVADRFLFDLRFRRDRAESTSRAYAGELAEFLAWCQRTGRSLEDGAFALSRFVLYLRTRSTTRPGSGQHRPPGAARVNHVLAVVREFYKHAAATRALPGEVLCALYEVADDRHLPAELRPESGGLRYRAKPSEAPWVPWRLYTLEGRMEP